MQPFTRHLHPQPAEAVARAALRALPEGCASIWVTLGQYAPDPTTAQRVLVLARVGEVVATVADAWVQRGDETALAAHLQEGDTRRAHCRGQEGDETVLAAHLQERYSVRVGESDAMYATPWRYAWTADGPQVEVWDEQGRVVWMDDRGTLRCRVRDRVTNPSVRAVEGWLSSDWMLRGVRLRLEDGGRVDVAQRTECTVAIDPAYDGLDLLCDASWVGGLARCLGHALDVPVELDSALQ